MKVVVQQAQFLPWIGFWHKMLSADRWVVYAGVQMLRRGHESRVTLDGSWLKVPVVKGPRDMLMKDAQIADLDELPRIAMRIRHSCMSKVQPYGRRLGEVVDLLEWWTDPSLLNLTTTLTEVVRDLLHIATPIHVDTTYRQGTAPEKLDQCMYDWGAKDCLYLSGGAGLDYMGFDSLKTPSQTRFQIVRKGLCPDSILQLIASEPDPLAAVRRAGTWMTKEGQFYEFDNTTSCADPRAAL